MLDIKEYKHTESKDKNKKDQNLLEQKNNIQIYSLKKP